MMPHIPCTEPVHQAAVSIYGEALGIHHLGIPVLGGERTVISISRLQHGSGR